MTPSCRERGMSLFFCLQLCPPSHHTHTDPKTHFTPERHEIRKGGYNLHSRMHTIHVDRHSFFPSIHNTITTQTNYSLPLRRGISHILFLPYRVLLFFSLFFFSILLSNPLLLSHRQILHSFPKQHPLFLVCYLYPNNEVPATTFTGNPLGGIYFRRQRQHPSFSL